jgi:hypothetical protein
MVVESRSFRSAASPLGQLPIPAISQLEQLLSPLYASCWCSARRLVNWYLKMAARHIVVESRIFRLAASALGQLPMPAISKLGQLVSPLGQLLVLCPPPGELVSKDGGQAHGGREQELQLSC